MSTPSGFLFVTDAWQPQTNGVVVLLTSLLDALSNLGFSVRVVHPAPYPKISLPKYPEIKIALTPWRIKDELDHSERELIHIVTEGPLGLAARRYCCKRKIPFTTAIHTKFPEYAHILTGAPLSWGYKFERWFHKPAKTTIVQTDEQLSELTRHGLKNLCVVGGGVDTNLFRPMSREVHEQPVLLFVGRVSKEKNLEDFLELDLDGEKVVVGDGPDRERLGQKYGGVRFTGYRTGEDLVREYANADCLVFPSRTDTFGLVLVEAMACGTPVACYPTTGPVDVVQHGITGYLENDLREAVTKALTLDRAEVRQRSLLFSWKSVAERFVRAHGVDIGSL